MNRFIHALRHETVLRLSTILRIALGGAGLVLIAVGLRWLGAVQPIDIWGQAYVPIMIIAGAIFAAESFRELQDDGHRIAFLMRPASLVEKVGSKLIVSALGAWLVITLAFLLLSLVAGLGYLALGGKASLFGEFFANGRWFAIAFETLIDFLPVHAIVFFGGVYFRKNPAAKTLPAVIGWVVSWALVTIVGARVVFSRYLRFEGGELEFVQPGPRGMLNFGGAMDGTVWRELVPFYLRQPEMIEPVVNVLVVVIFWSLAVLRLRETEV